MIHSRRGDVFPYKSGYCIEEKNYIDIFTKISDCDSAISLYGKQIRNLNKMISKYDKRNHKMQEKVDQLNISMTLLEEAKQDLEREYRSLSEFSKSVVKDEPKVRFWNKKEVWGGTGLGIGLILLILI